MSIPETTLYEPPNTFDALFDNTLSPETYVELLDIEELPYEADPDSPDAPALLLIISVRLPPLDTS